LRDTDNGLPTQHGCTLAQRLRFVDHDGASRDSKGPRQRRPAIALVTRLPEKEKQRNHSDAPISVAR